MNADAPSLSREGRRAPGPEGRRPLSFLIGAIPHGRRGSPGFWASRLPPGARVEIRTLRPEDRLAPYFPLLDLIRGEWLGRSPEEREAILAGARIHHRCAPIVRSWLETGAARRGDDLFRPKAEFDFEREHLFSGLSALMAGLWPEKGPCLVIENFENAGRPLARLFLWLAERGSATAASIVCVIGNDGVIGTRWPPEFRDRFFAVLEDGDLISHARLAIETEPLEAEARRGPAEAFGFLPLSNALLALDEAAGFASLPLKPLSPRAALDARMELGRMELMSGDLKAALYQFTEALELGRLEGAQAELARIHAAMAICYFFSADKPGRDRHLLMARKIQADCGDRQLGLYLDYLRAVIQESYNSDPASFPQIQALESRLEGEGAEDLVLGLRSTLWYLDGLIRARGWEDAVAETGASLKRAEAIGNRHQMAAINHMLGYLHQLKGEGAEALPHFDACIGIRKTLGDNGELARAFNGAGYLCFTLGMAEKALAYFGDSFEILQARSDYAETCVTLFNIASVYFFSGAFPASLEVLQSLLSVMDNLGMEDLPFHRRRKLLSFAGAAACLQGRQSVTLEYWSLSRNAPEDPLVGPIGPFLEYLVDRMLREEAEADDALGRALSGAEREGQTHFLPFLLMEEGRRAAERGQGIASEEAFDRAEQAIARGGFKAVGPLLALLRAGGEWKDCPPAMALDERIRLLSSGLAATAHQEATNQSILRKVNDLAFLKDFQAAITRDSTKERLFKDAATLLRRSYPLGSIHFLEARREPEIVWGHPRRKTVKPEWQWERLFRGWDFVGLSSLDPGDGGRLLAYAFQFNPADRLWAVLTAPAGALRGGDEEILALALHHLDLTLDLQKAKQELQEAFSLDPLTGAMTRQAFLGRMKEERIRHTRYAGERESGFAVLFMDLDNFKFYNDTFGHPAGDFVLRAFSRLVSGCVRDLDFLGRMGGDEFVLLLPYAGASEARIVAGRILSKLGAADGFRSDLGLDREGAPVLPPDRRLGCSIGIAAFDAKADASGEELLEAADGALYEAKKAGKGQVRVAGERTPTA